MPEPRRCQRAARLTIKLRRALTLPHTGGSVATHSSQGRFMSKKQAIDLEKALSDLEELVEELESGDLPLEQAMKKFEEGIKLTRGCQAALKEAEQKVEVLLNSAGGEDLEDFAGVGHIHAYVAPLSPFLDPGSRAFEDPRFGYQVRYRSLEEHRRAMLQPSWKDILSFESATLTREELSQATYEVARELNQLKFRYGLIDAATYAAVASRLRTAESVLADVDRAATLPADKQREAYAQIRERLRGANGVTLCGEDEMKWPLVHRFHLGATLARGLAAGLDEA